MRYVSSSIRFDGRQKRFVALLLAVATAFGMLVAAIRPAAAAVSAPALVLAVANESRACKPGGARSSTEHAEPASGDGLEPVLCGRPMRRSSGAETPAPHLGAMPRNDLRLADVSFVAMGSGERTHVVAERARALSMVFLN